MLRKEMVLQAFKDNKPLKGRQVCYSMSAYLDSMPTVALLFNMLQQVKKKKLNKSQSKD